MSSIKKTEFDEIQIEVVEAALWLSTESAQQDGSDYKQLQKRHKEVVKVMNGIAKYFAKYTEPTNLMAVIIIIFGRCVFTEAAFCQFSSQYQHPPFHPLGRNEHAPGRPSRVVLSRGAVVVESW